MKKICLFIFVSFLAMGLFAGFVPVKDAEKVAKSHFYQSNTKSLEWKNIELSLKVDPSKNSEYKFYVFDVNNEEGWIIVSSDNNIQPILAYSFEGQFNHDNMAPAQKAFFDYFSESIEYASKNPETKSEKNLNKWKKLLEFDPAKDSRAKSTTSPVLLGGIKWNQDSPYNSACPEVNSGGSGGRAYVGCVATAMGQVMKYYNWPPSGNGSVTHTYYLNNRNNTVTVNFLNQTYDWYSVPDVAKIENSELGKINFHLGAALRMGWGADGSGTQTDYIPNALKTYFKYNTSAEMKSRLSTTPEADWINLIKQEIDAKRPLVYAGHSSTVGHAWNCDGYQEVDGDYTFHMNWGWGGSGDTYCTINRLVSAGSPGGPQEDFINNQRLVIGISPNSQYPTSCSGVTTITGHEGTISSGNPTSNYRPNTNCTYVIKPNCGNLLKVKFSKFDLVEGDVVEIYNGDENSTVLLATLDTENLPGNLEYSSEEGAITVRFKTTASSTGAEGWKINYSTVTCSSNPIVLTEPSGTFDDGSGPCKYGNTLNCTWIIEPGDVSNIQLTFEEFNMGEATDNVKIYKDSDSPTNMVAQYDGSSFDDEPLLIESSKVIIKFSTSRSGEVADGWKVKYRTNYTSVTNQKGSISDLYVMPNPGNGDSKLVFSMKKNSDVRIFISNVIGEIVAEKNINSLTGTNELYLNNILNSTLKNGIYYINIQSEGQIVSTKYVVIN